MSGRTIYYNASNAGLSSFTLTQTTSDDESGIATVAFPSLTNFTGGGTDSSSPYSTTYTWNSSATASGAQNVTATNDAGATGTYTGAFTLTPDSTAPTGASAALSGGPWYTSASVPLTLSNGSDAGSGMNTSTQIVERDSATLSGGTCGTFSGSYSTVTLSGGADTTVVTGNCYRYRLKISDNVGNQATSAASADAKVDTSAPSISTLAPTEVSGAGNQYYDGSGTMYFRPAGSGSFALNASASDSQSARRLGLVPRPLVLQRLHRRRRRPGREPAVHLVDLHLDGGRDRQPGRAVHHRAQRRRRERDLGDHDLARLDRADRPVGLPDRRARLLDAVRAADDRLGQRRRPPARRRRPRSSSATRRRSRPAPAAPSPAGTRP